MSDKDDIFDMEFGEETTPSPPRHHRMRSTSLSVTLHHSKSLLKSKEIESKNAISKDYESATQRKPVVPPTAPSEEEEEEEQANKEQQEDDETANNENETGAQFVPSRNYNNVKMKYFQALNISKRTAPIDAAPRKDPNEAFSKPILSAPTHSAPIPIAADRFVRYEITGQTLNTVTKLVICFLETYVLIESCASSSYLVRPSSRNGTEGQGHEHGRSLGSAEEELQRNLTSVVNYQKRESRTQHQTFRHRTGLNLERESSERVSQQLYIYKTFWLVQKQKQQQQTLSIFFFFFFFLFFWTRGVVVLNPGYQSPKTFEVGLLFKMKHVATISIVRYRSPDVFSSFTSRYASSESFESTRNNHALIKYNSRLVFFYVR